LTFFEELLKEKTIVVPGIFFEINPSHRRDLFKSPCHHFVRISFGPPLRDLDMGMSANHIPAQVLMILRSGCDGARTAKGEEGGDEAVWTQLFQVC
jgi:hypothetical protein